MGTHTLLLNGKQISVEAESDVRMRRVLRDIESNDRVARIEGLAKTATGAPHPVPEAWITDDVAACGYCQRGRIMAATALINRVQRSGRKISEADLDTLRNVCRCGTYPHIRDAVRHAAATIATT